MANVPIQPTWTNNVYQLEITDWVYGGAPSVNPDGTPTAVGHVMGLSNVPIKNLADRTQFLYLKTLGVSSVNDYAGSVFNWPLAADNMTPDFISYNSLVTPTVLDLNFAFNDPLVVSFAGGNTNGFFSPVGFINAPVTGVTVYSANTHTMVCAQLNPLTNNAEIISIGFDLLDPTITDFPAIYSHNDPRNIAFGSPYTDIPFWFDLTNNTWKYWDAPNSQWSVLTIVPLFAIKYTVNGTVDVMYAPYKVDLYAKYGNKIHSPGTIMLLHDKQVDMFRNGWLMIDVNQTGYVDYHNRLYNVIANTYGTPPNPDLFRLPSLPPPAPGAGAYPILTGAHYYIKT
jgi:hypothetical protein